MRYSIKLLNKSYIASNRTLMLESFNESPYAFSESLEDDFGNDKAYYNEVGLRGTTAENFILGAFDEIENLIRFVTFRRDTRIKARHKSMIHATYLESELKRKIISEDLNLMKL